MKTRNIVAIVLCFLALGGTAGAQRGSVPVAVEYAPLPSTVEDLVKAADLVVVATLESPQYEETATKLLRTRFRAAVIEIVSDKRKGPMGPVIDLYRLGGRKQTEKGPKDIDELSFRRWSEGMQLLLFLVWHTGANAYFPLGPDGAYQFDPVTGKVRAFGKGAVARAWHGKEISHVVEEAKSKARVQRP
jgi:hypothetical protein